MVTKGVGIVQVSGLRLLIMNGMPGIQDNRPTVALKIMAA